jgi:starch synthase
VPVVRATGGLHDTVEEWQTGRKTGTGFKFEGYSPEALLTAIDSALASFHDKDSWRQLMLNGMACNFSWDQPAREYASVYEEVARRRA